MNKKRQKPEKLLMRIGKGCIEPADRFVQERLREKGYRIGDDVLVQISKARVGWQHRRAHLLGALISENIESFEGLDAHKVLKRIQLEGNIACEEVAIIIEGQQILYRIPQSLSYANMDQAYFEEIYSAMCRYVSEKYWPDLSENQIAEMSELMQ